MAITHEAAAPSTRSRFRRAADTALVRAIGRLPLPLGGKLLAAFAIVAALLCLVATLGLVALGRSNTRGVQLLRLQQKAVYFQLVLTDATQLNAAIRNRIQSPVAPHEFGGGFDQSIAIQFNQLCVDAGVNVCNDAPAG